MSALCSRFDGVSEEVTGIARILTEVKSVQRIDLYRQNKATMKFRV
jgi:hypothetical protein